MLHGIKLHFPVKKIFEEFINILYCIFEINKILFHAKFSKTTQNRKKISIALLYINKQRIFEVCKSKSYLKTGHILIFTYKYRNE